jgi:hypothetical protein
MPKLWIANLSKQNHDFLYRLPGRKGLDPLLERIPIGQQVAIGGLDLTSEEIAYVIEQHTPYGLRDANELSSLKTYAGRCYSIGTPVKLDNMLYVFEKNDESLNVRAAEIREDQAAVISGQIQETMSEHGVNVPRTTVETMEETSGTPKLAQGFESVQPGVEPRHGGRQGRRGS